jgi:hypothetical protein
MYIVRSHFLKFLHCIMFLLQLSAIALIAKMAAFTPEIIKAIAEVKVSDLELNNKKVQIFKILDEAGLSWFEDVHPDIILTHPKNRGTLCGCGRRHVKIDTSLCHPIQHRQRR